MKLALAGLLAAACAITPVFAQTVRDINAGQQTVVDAWKKTPLSVRRALFVTAKAPVYGAYDERRTNTFRASEPLITYIEPVGYTWKPAKDDEFRFGVLVDFTVKTASGTILGGKDGFLNYSIISHHRVRELMINSTINLHGIKSGNYILTFTIHDINDPNRMTSVDQPFTIVQ